MMHMTSNGPTAEQWVQWDNDYLWHPFTPMKRWISEGDQPGRFIEAADRFELIDIHDQHFIDGFSSLWCNLHGHRVPEIDQALRDQIDKIAHSTLLGHASLPSIELAKRLVEISPKGLDKVFYSDSGATAVEIAIKMAFQYFRNTGQPERQNFIALRDSYHGDTVGSVSVGGIETFHGIFQPLLFETTFVDAPNPYHHPAGQDAGAVVLQQIEDILKRDGQRYCAVIAEPLVQGAAGILTHTKGFLKGLRELTRKYGVLLICDEVATGFCRTGKLFACQHEDVAPDLMSLGKGLTGGYLPVAATLCSQEIFDGFYADPTENKTFYHGHTFTGNALGCAAAVASVDLIFSSGLLDHLDEKVSLISRHLDALRDHPHVGDIRQCGMMAGIELVADRKTKTPFDPARYTGAAVCKAALKHGIIIRPLSDVVVLMPAPAIDTPTLQRLLTGVVETINEHFA